MSPLLSLPLYGVTVLLLASCAWVDGKGLVSDDATKPDREQKLAANRAEGKTIADARDRDSGALTGSLALVDKELRFHLPPANKDSAPNRLTVKKRGGVFFGGGTYEITAIATFTPQQREKFIDAARRLQGHLDENPTFRLRLYRPTTGEPELLEEIEID